MDHMNNGPRIGQSYRFTDMTVLPDGFIINKGDKLRLIEPTGQSPHGWFDSITGHNWIAQGPNGVTVWSSIPWAIDIGLLELVGS